MDDEDRGHDARFDDEGETEEQRERYRELLEEIRTIMPGTQVLFAFLLTAAFSTGFKNLDDLGKRTFAVALLVAAMAALTLMGPAAYHRMSASGKRAERLHVSEKLQVVGMALLLVSMTLVTFVVARLIFADTTIGLIFGGATLATGIGIWYLLPRAAHLHQDD